VNWDAIEAKPINPDFAVTDANGYGYMNCTDCYAYFGTGFGLEITLSTTSMGVPNGLSKIGGYLIGNLIITIYGHITLDSTPLGI
jgi:hypothetical protein